MWNSNALLLLLNLNVVCGKKMKVESIEIVLLADNMNSGLYVVSSQNFKRIMMQISITFSSAIFFLNEKSALRPV